jgi:hypothetical protein
MLLSTAFLLIEPNLIRDVIGISLLVGVFIWQRSNAGQKVLSGKSQVDSVG